MTKDDDLSGTNSLEFDAGVKIGGRLILVRHNLDQCQNTRRSRTNVGHSCPGGKKYSCHLIREGRKREERERKEREREGGREGELDDYSLDG